MEPVRKRGGSLIVGIDGRELQGQPTGVGRYLRSILRHWTTAGQDRFVVYFNGPAPADPVLHHDSVTLRALGDKPTRGVTWVERRLPAAAAADGLSVLFAPAYVCPMNMPTPRVTTVHDMSFFSCPGDFAPLDRWKRRLLVRASMTVSRRVLAVSAFTAAEIARWVPSVEPLVRVTPLGPDEDLPAAPDRAAARARLRVDGPLVLTVGSVLNRRRITELLTAMTAVAQRFPGVVLDVVGDNRTHPRLDLGSLVRKMHLQDRVRLSGFVSEADLADRYAAADVAVQLSDYEGFGLPALEAMARGVAVVTSDRPALSDNFGRAALLVDASEPAAIAAAIERVLGDATVRADLVARGRALAAEHSWETTARLTRAALVEAYEK